MAEENFIREPYGNMDNPFDNPEIEEYLFSSGEQDPDETDEFIDFLAERIEEDEEDE